MKRGRVGWRDRDHTRGSLLVSLGVLALPLLAQSGSGVVFQLTDLSFLARLGEDATTAVVVTNQALRQVVFMLVMGASFGAQGLISRCVGEGRPEAAEHVAGQVVLMGGAFSLVVAVLGYALGPALLGGLNVSDEVLREGTPYVRLVFLLNFGFVFGFLFNAILNGAGDATTPLLVSVLQAGLSLLGEWCLMFGHLGAPALGVRGAAYGMAIGQVAGLGVAYWVLFRGKSRVHLRLHHLRPDRAAIARIAGLSWPPALQMIGGFLVNVVFIRLMGRFGDEAQAAYSIGLRLSMVGPMLAFPLAGATSTLVGQSLGARNVPRAWRSIGVGLAAHVVLLWSVALGLAFFREPVLRLFADDPAVIAIGSQMLLYQAGTFAVWAFFFVFFRALQGAGDVQVPMLLTLGNSLLLTLPLGYFLSLRLDWGPSGVFAASLVGAVVVTAGNGLWLSTGRWTRRAPLGVPRRGDGGLPTPDAEG